MKRIAIMLCAALSCVAFTFTSCGSSENAAEGAKSEKKAKSGKKDKMTAADYLVALNDGDYASCMQYLADKNAKKETGDIIRDNFDLAMMKHYQKDYDGSLALLNATNEKMKDSVTKSITKGFAAAVANENAAEYAGTPYEYIYINLFNALNYYGKGDVEGAGVEVRQLNDKQKEYLVKYGEWVTASDDEEEAEGGDEKAGAAYKMLQINPTEFNGKRPAKPTSADVFRDSAAARYLSMLFYMMDKDADNAALDARTLNAINGSFDTASELNIASGKGRLDVLAFANLIGRRGESRKIFGPIGPIFIDGTTKDGKPTRMAIPPFDLEFAYPVYPAPTEAQIKEEILDRYAGWVFAEDKANNIPATVLKPGKTEAVPQAPQAVTAIKVVLASGEEKTLPLLEDFSYAVQQDVNTKARKAYNRSIPRSIVKKAAAVTAGSVALSAVTPQPGQPLNPVSWKVYAAAFVKLSQAVDAIDMTETADVRQVYALPGQAYAAGFELDPGTYSGKVVYFAADGSVIAEEPFENVVVKAGVPVLVEASCQK